MGDTNNKEGAKVQKPITKSSKKSLIETHKVWAYVAVGLRSIGVAALSFFGAYLLFSFFGMPTSAVLLLAGAIGIGKFTGSCCQYIGKLIEKIKFAYFTNPKLSWLNKLLGSKDPGKKAKIDVLPDKKLNPVTRFFNVLAKYPLVWLGMLSEGGAVGVAVYVALSLKLSVPIFVAAPLAVAVGLAAFIMAGGLIASRLKAIATFQPRLEEASKVMQQEQSTLKGFLDIVFNKYNSKNRSDLFSDINEVKRCSEEHEDQRCSQENKTQQHQKTNDQPSTNQISQNQTPQSLSQTKNQLENQIQTPTTGGKRSKTTKQDNSRLNQVVSDKDNKNLQLENNKLTDYLKENPKLFAAAKARIIKEIKRLQKILLQIKDYIYDKSVSVTKSASKFSKLPEKIISGVKYTDLIEKTKELYDYKKERGIYRFGYWGGKSISGFRALGTATLSALGFFAFFYSFNIGIFTIIGLTLGLCLGIARGLNSFYMYTPELVRMFTKTARRIRHWFTKDQQHKFGRENIKANLILKYKIKNAFVTWLLVLITVGSDGFSGVSGALNLGVKLSVLTMAIFSYSVLHWFPLPVLLAIAIPVGVASILTVLGLTRDKIIDRLCKDSSDPVERSIQKTYSSLDEQEKQLHRIIRFSENLNDQKLSKTLDVLEVINSEYNKILYNYTNNETLSTFEKTEKEENTTTITQDSNICNLNELQTLTNDSKNTVINSDIK